MIRSIAAAVVVVAFGVLPVLAREKADERSGRRTLQPEDLKALEWRSIGPANMGGRVSSISLAPGNPKTYCIGYGTGGVWKISVTWSSSALTVARKRSSPVFVSAGIQ